MNEVTKLNMVTEFWRHADDGLRPEFDRMRTGFNFYVGNQWDNVDLEKLQSEKRPALTINMILPIVNLLAGIQRQGRQDITVIARRNGIAKIADVLTETIRHCIDVTDGDYEIADCFLDGIIGNKGWLNIGIDYSDDPVHGDIVLSKVSPFDMREDPDAKEYDLNRSGKFVIRDYWFDKDALRLNYPNKARDIEQGGLDIDPASGDIIGDPEKDRFRWRVRECWWKQHVKQTVLINAATGVIKTISDGNIELAKAIAQADRKWHVKDWIVPVLNKTVTAGNIILEDVADPYTGVTRFPYYRFCPFWVDGYVMGVTQNLIGPQQEVNKRRSQALHNLNQTANSGFKVKKVLNNYDRHLAKHGATPGIVLDESKAGGSIERIEPVPLSEGHITSAKMSADDMKEISGANPDLLGQVVEGYQESGKAIELRQAQGMKVVEVLFDNFARTQKLVALGLVDMVRFTDVYSDEEIKAIAGDKVSGINFDLLKKKSIGKYGIKIESSSSSPTAKYANFTSILEIARMFPERIGAEIVIENSDIFNKDKVLQQVKSADRSQVSEGRGQKKTSKLKTTKDFVNTLS